MNPKKAMKPSLFGKVGVLALCLSGAAVTQAKDFKWTATEAGDLMVPTNWDQQAVPASGDKLTVDGQNGVQLGTFTFPKRMPASGTLNTLNFTQKNQGKARSMDPGKDHELYATYFNIRYSEVFSILSGRYFLTTSIGVGNSTSSSDTSYLTVSGEDTFLQAPLLAVGSGSTTSGRSIAHVSVTDKAIVDSAVTVGMSGGWKNSLAVSGAGTHLYSTNAASRIGTETIVQEKTVYYSQNNLLAVTNQAEFTSEELQVGSESDLGTAGNVFLLSGQAAATIGNVQLYGTNTVRIADNSQLNAAAINVGASWKGGAGTCSSGALFAVSNSTVTVADKITVGRVSDVSCGNRLLISDQSTLRSPTLAIAGSNEVCIANGSQLLDVANLYVGHWEGGAETCGSGSVFEVTNGTVSVTELAIVGSTSRASSGNELRVSGGGVLTTPKIDVGFPVAGSLGNILSVDPNGVVTSGVFYAYATNRVNVAGLLVVTDSINIGRTEVATGGWDGSELAVCGGTLFMDVTSTFYIGTYNKVSNGNKVSVTDGGQLVLTNANYIFIGAMGRDNSLTVSGAGSRLAHYSYNTARNVLVGVIGKWGDGEHPEYTADNALVVSDGASFSTTASVLVGNGVSNSTFTVDQAMAKVGQNVEIGNGATATPALMKIVGSNARLTAKTLTVGAEGRIVFDLADAKSSEEALVQLTSKPTFAAGSTIYITSSNPDVTKSEKFDATLLSCAADMDLSNVSIEIDPDSGLRRRAVSNPRALCVRGGRPSGLMMIFR